MTKRFKVRSVSKKNGNPSSFSIDATEDRFNYIRHHGDWSAVTDNINKWLEHKSDSIIFDVAVTVTNLNIFYLEPRCLQRGSLVLRNKINICLLRQLVFLIAVMVGSLS